MPHVLPYVDGPVYGTPLTLALVEPKLREHGLDGAHRLVPVAPARPRDGRSVRDRVHPRHAQHARLRGAGDSHAGRRRRPHRRLQDRSDADRRRALRRAPLRRARRAAACWRCSADSTNIDRRGFTGSEREVIDAFEEIFTSATGRLIVAAFASSIYRMQILVDLAAQFDRKVAFVGRGMIENSQIAQRLGYLQHSAGRPDSRLRDRQLSRRRTCCACAPDRRASRCRRCRASRSTITAT